MIRAWWLARKDIKEAFGRRTLLLRTVVPAGFIALIYGLMTGLALRAMGGEGEMPDALLRQIPFFAALAVLIGSFVAVAVAADAIAGEKERRTIESLLAAPITDLELFAGKVIAGFLPAVAVGYGAGLLYFAMVLAIAGLGVLGFPTVVFAARLMVVTVPVVAAILCAVGVMISSRVGSATSAMQISGWVTLPVAGIVMFVAFVAGDWAWYELLALFGALGLIGVLLLFLGAQVLGREEIIARLD